MPLTRFREFVEPALSPRERREDRAFEPASLGQLTRALRERNVENFQDVRRRARQNRAIADQRVTPLDVLAIDVARNREDRNPPRRPIRRIQGPAARRRLDDKNGVNERRDDGIAFEKLMRQCGMARRPQREHCAPASDHPMRQLVIAWRKERLVSAPEYANGRRTGFERALVRQRIDAERKTRNDAASGGPEVTRKRTGDMASIAARASCTDDGYARPAEAAKLPA